VYPILAAPDSEHRPHRTVPAALRDRSEYPRRPDSLEIKGKDSEQTCAKLAAMRAWVEAVNAKGGFGGWCCDVVYEMAKMQDVLAAHCFPLQRSGDLPPRGLLPVAAQRE